MQNSPVVVTDSSIGAIRSTVMADDPATEEPGFDSRTCCEHVVVFTATTLEALQLDPDDAACPDKLGAMTANAFGYSNTAEAFIAIEVCPCAAANTFCFVSATVALVMFGKRKIIGNRPDFPTI